MDFVDYYKIMGLSESATDEQIKKAYRKLARKFHPDVSKEADSEERFKEVGEAYQVLKNPERRQEYDELRRYGRQTDQTQTGQGFRPPPGWQSHASDSSQSDTFDYSDFFEEVFGNRSYGRASPHHEQQFGARGQDQHSRLSITLRDAFGGATLPLTLRVPVQHADGSIRVEQKTLHVKIPKGVVDGQKIRLRGQGGPGLGDAPAGDLYLEIELQNDRNFQHDGKDIIVKQAVFPWVAALGGVIKVNTLGGNIKLTIPENSQSGKKLRLRGRGLPGNPPGDQYVVLTINWPKATTEEQKDYYRSMQQLWDETPHKSAEG